MEFLKKIGSWADELTKIGISIIALGHSRKSCGYSKKG